MKLSAEQHWGVWRDSNVQYCVPFLVCIWAIYFTLCPGLLSSFKTVMHTTAWNSFHLSKEQTDGFIVKDFSFWPFLIPKLVCNFRNASVDNVHQQMKQRSSTIIFNCAEIIRKLYISMIFLKCLFIILMFTYNVNKVYCSKNKYIC